MTDRDLCIKLLKNMVKYGYALFGETPEHMVDRIGADIEFWARAYNKFMLS